VEEKDAQRGDECQYCHHPVREGEDLSTWMQCEDCIRSWHKTCVGIKADKPLEEIEWSRCVKCDGRDPKGPQLEKRRKMPVCTVCHQRLRDIDHSACRQRKEEIINTSRAPKVQVKRKEMSQPRLQLHQAADEKRKSRRPRKRRRRKGIEVTEEQLRERMALL